MAPPSLGRLCTGVGGRPSSRRRGARLPAVAAFLLALLAARAAAPRLLSAFCGGAAARLTSATSHRQEPLIAARQAAEGREICLTAQGKELERLLRGAPGHEEPGHYVIKSKAFVGPGKELGPPPFLAELGPGSVVEVAEVEVLENAHRVRARLVEPEGWISLRNLETGHRWAERTVALSGFDDMIGDCWEAADSDGPTAWLLRSDLLYLSAVRKFAVDNTPRVPSLDSGDPHKTFTFSGHDSSTEMDSWRQIALPQVVNEVPLESATPQLRSAILTGHEPAAKLLDTYIEHFTLNLAATHDPSHLPYASFLRALEETKLMLMMRIGGASGESDATNTTAVHDVNASPQNTDEWGPWFASILAATRLSAADRYFSDLLFGLCLRRLSRRFEIERRFGLIPELSEEALQRVRLERSVDDDGAAEAAIREAQLELFADTVAKSHADWKPGDSGALDTMLSISETTLAAMRRQVDFVFGKDIRKEFDEKMNEAREGIEAQSLGEISWVETSTNLLMEAAAHGSVRMFVGTREAKERLTWDAIAYGAFLQDAEDAAPSA